ncbi:hypothetical protein CO154_02100 [Candidatus Pacearchaeota archaeon CG_4_9_14_3_um_filter_31_7]|nr:MAG: hypothetical protein AUJ10_03600 [Candidatus Pacearchaeota archaeon CG1_02_31_27]PIN91853.1 MAG: hypothetical protein COU55_03685 [Candidatus Pacearchaeota archaeon CG10_big_fil_rev_8_21_14_0_10_31_59]PIZ80520.1 MAG: hypothetical protein COX99_02495 [Candidatus Pacearchaeota archaeon CG_4_10_14_0_2_um_filter_31_10]PJA70602.1 MAG: hypothetical protein CO154_02100 [Candidatus Pacearchaeota archaeon CG_4_9_14_3_um_filter_31_7]
MGIKDLFRKKKKISVIDLTPPIIKKRKEDVKGVTSNTSENEDSSFLSDFASSVDSSETSNYGYGSESTAYEPNDEIRILKRKIYDLEQRIELLERKISKSEYKKKVDKNDEVVAY